MIRKAKTRKNEKEEEWKIKPKEKRRLQGQKRKTKKEDIHEERKIHQRKERRKERYHGWKRRINGRRSDRERGKEVGREGDARVGKVQERTAR